MMQPTRKHRGFTLIEIMIVVAIIAILASVALPLYQGYINTAKVNASKANLEIAYRNLKSELIKLTTTNAPPSEPTVLGLLNQSGAKRNPFDQNLPAFIDTDCGADGQVSITGITDLTNIASNQTAKIELCSGGGSIDNPPAVLFLIYE